jgi:hypothetical protein
MDDDELPEARRVRRDIGCGLAAGEVLPWAAAALPAMSPCGTAREAEAAAAATGGSLGRGSSAGAGCGCGPICHGSVLPWRSGDSDSLLDLSSLWIRCRDSTPSSMTTGGSTGWAWPGAARWPAGASGAVVADVSAARRRSSSASRSSAAHVLKRAGLGCGPRVTRGLAGSGSGTTSRAGAESERSTGRGRWLLDRGRVPWAAPRSAAGDEDRAGGASAGHTDAVCLAARRAEEVSESLVRG